MKYKNIALALLGCSMITTYMFHSSPTNNNPPQLSSHVDFVLEPSQTGWDVITENNRYPLTIKKNQLNDAVAMEYYHGIHDKNIQMHNLDYRYASVLVLEVAVQSHWTEEQLFTWMNQTSPQQLIPWIVEQHHHHNSTFKPSSTEEYQWLAGIERTLFDKRVLHIKKIENML